MRALTPGQLGQLSVILLLTVVAAVMLLRAMRQAVVRRDAARRRPPRLIHRDTPYPSRRSPQTPDERAQLERDIQELVDRLRERVELTP